MGAQMQEKLLRLAEARSISSLRTHHLTAFALEHFDDIPRILEWIAEVLGAVSRLIDRMGGAPSAALTPPRPRLFSAIGGMSFGCSSGLFGAPIRPLCEEFLRPD